MKILYLLLISMILPLNSKANDMLNGQWIDLTHDFSAKTIYWPTAKGFEKTTDFQGYTDGGYYYEAHSFSSAEHGGTHIDAPIHFYKGRHTVDKISLEQLIGDGVVIRIVEQAKSDRNYQLSVKDILAWETQYGTIPAGSIVLIDTGSSHLWPDRKIYMGTDERGAEAVKKLRFPGIHPTAAKLFVERGIKAVGLDTPSIDYGGSTLFETHQTLFEHNIPGFENVAHISQLPTTGFTVIALPMKIKEGSGAPLRIVAFVPTKTIEKL